MRKKYKILVMIFLAIVLVLVLHQGKYESALKMGGQWFLNNENDEFVNYKINLTEEMPIQSRNSLRETACLWAVSELGKEYGWRYERLAKKGWDFFEDKLLYDKKNDLMYSSITRKKKIGYNAFLILTLLNLNVTGKNFYIDKLANGIIFQQEKNGKLKTLFGSDVDDGVEFYPGESLLAMMRLYRETGNKKYLEVVKKALPYYRKYFKEHKSLAFVPWQTRAYYEFWKETGDENAKDFVFEMNNYMIERFGGCGNLSFRGISTAVYIEGMVQAFKLANETNYEMRDCYKEFILEGLNFVISLQVKKGKESGGFKLSPNSEIIRCDNNQHGVFALLETKRAGLIN